MKLSAIELNRLAAEAERFSGRGFSSISVACKDALSIVDELIAARDAIAATKLLLARPEVKLAASMAPGLRPDIQRLLDALKTYEAK